MKNQREIYEALLAGETMIHSSGNKVKMDAQGHLNDVCTFTCPSEWHIYTKPKWYENIPDGGVLCWCWDNDPNVKSAQCITDRCGDDGIRDFKGVRFFWDNATPLTKEEIQVFMDNAPNEVTE